MATTTSITIPWTVVNTIGITGYVVQYRLHNTSLWTQVQTSGQTVSISGLAINRIYDITVQTINGTTNPVSAISNAINITDPGPSFSLTSTTIAFSFPNLSPDIDSYVTTIALASNPNSIIATNTLEPNPTVTNIFSGLLPLTNYVITITPAANQFYKQFSYNQSTLLNTNCAAPTNVTATLNGNT